MENKTSKIITWIVSVILVGLFIYSLFFTNITKYKLTFISNGMQIGSAEVKENGYVKIPEDDPVKEGYKFMYWEIDGVKVTGKERINKDTILNAVFEEIEKTTTTTTKAAKKSSKKK